MNDNVKTPVLVAAAVVAVALLVFFGMRSVGSGGLDQGQIKYTPGKPPWQETDPSKRGPGGSPGGGGPGAPPQQSAQINPTTTGTSSSEPLAQAPIQQQSAQQAAPPMSQSAPAQGQGYNPPGVPPGPGPGSQGTPTGGDGAAHAPPGMSAPRISNGNN